MDRALALQLSEIDFARNRDEAFRRADMWKDVDPYPEIAPALLNSIDICSYFNAASVVYPVIPEQLKACAYELTLGDTVLYWDSGGVRRFFKGLKSGSPVDFPPNSIVYVTTTEEFFIPDYLALRFNMVIKHVHKGMLLGTGPLINPGFRGKIMIPIFNFTRNSYSIEVGDRLVSIEITKISSYDQQNRPLKPSPPVPTGRYVPNDSDYIGANFKKFLLRAIGPGKKIRSSIEEALAGVEDRLTTVENETKAYAEGHVQGAKAELDSAIVRIKEIEANASLVTGRVEESLSRFKRWSVVGIIALAVTVAGLFVSVYTYHVNVVAAFSSQPDHERYIAEEYKSEMRRQQAELDSVRRELKETLHELEYIKHSR